MGAKDSNIACRVSPELRAKAEAVAKAERRKLADLARLAIEDYVAAYEAEHGPIPTPPPPPAAAAAGGA